MWVVNVSTVTELVCECWEVFYVRVYVIADSDGTAAMLVCVLVALVNAATGLGGECNAEGVYVAVLHGVSAWVSRLVPPPRGARW